jgi:DHA1 family multidrug resistance protein-like MFS transporter
VFRPLDRLKSTFRALVPPGPEGLVWWLTALASLGVTSVIPLFPLYAKQQGADLHMIGVMTAAFLVTNLGCLYAAGKLSDRLGRRPLMAAGLLGFAFCSLGFLWLRDPWAFTALRALEGVAAACFLPAALAYVADRYPAHERGTRIAQLAMAENLGLLLGPVFGGLLAAACGLSSLFASLAVMCFVGGIMVYNLPRDAAHVNPEEHLAKGPGRWSDVRLGLLLGVGSRAMAGGFAFGLYQTVWPIFMQRLGAIPWDVSMSWTLFAVPSIFLAAYSGKLIDRHSPGPSAVVGAIFSAIVVGSYALVPNVHYLLLLCMVEGIGFAFAYPAQNALTIHCAPEMMRGRVIGVVTAVKTLGALVGALATPWLYGISARYCFGAASLVLLVGAIVLALSLLLERRRPPDAQVPSALPTRAPEGVAIP